MKSNTLSSAEKSRLRGQAQRLKPRIHVGKNGVTQTVLEEVLLALEKEALIKVRFVADRATLPAQLAQICEKTDCECVGQTGKTAVLYLPPKDRHG